MAVKQTAGRDSLGEFAPKFAELNDDVLFGEVWSRTDSLSLRDRSLVTVVAMMSQGLTDSSFRYHLEAAKRNGITRREIAEILTHAAFYAGWPKAWAAFNMAKEVWADDTEGDDPMSAHQRSMAFPIGVPNDAFAQYFIGRSWIAPLASEPLPISNVTFEPGCRNNWHIHTASSGGGQVLICVAGEGRYQEWGGEIRELHPGDVVNIMPGVKHWHGAAPDSWFSHLAIAVPGTDAGNEWLEPVDDSQYRRRLGRRRPRRPLGLRKPQKRFISGPLSAPSIVMHWADVIAKDVVDTCDHPLIATGISPTGILHVGSLREAITGESIRSAVEATGKDVRLIYLIDDFDPLRKRYAFLPEEYEKYVGMPICRIPCPCGKHNNYAHHFVQPFLDTIETLGMKCEIIWTHELYEKGEFAECIDKAMTKRQEVIDILHEVTGKDMDPNYAPFNPICSKCGRFAHPIFDTYEFPHVEYQCVCGNHGVANITKGEGKLTWRLEWPAKWYIFGTSAEPFGKDHASAGGSYESGKIIIERIYGGRAPFPIPYEFVQLKGVGQMHKSLGSPVTGLDAIKMMPPEVLNYLFLRVNPSRAIDFDAGLGVLDMIDEYDRMERLYFEGEWTEAEENSVAAYKIAQHNHIPSRLPLQVPCRHLVNVVQMATDFDDVVTILKRTMDLSQATMEDMQRLRVRVDSLRYWLNGFAPDSVKFSIRQTIPTSITLSMNEKVFFQQLVTRFNDVPWDVDSINYAFNEVAKSMPIGLKGAYKAMYKILIAKEAGPRLGPFLASMDKKFVINRLVQASVQ